MQITKNSLETTPGPSDWFTGAVYIDTVAVSAAAGRSRSSGPATASSSNLARTTGTAPPPTAS